MRVSLLVLSGSRKGECLEMKGDEFRVGDEPSCEVCFSPEKDPAAHGVCIRIRREEDGWRASSLSGRESLVNQQMLETSLPIRSGDVVRLSPTGPDLRFNIGAPVKNNHPCGATPLSDGHSIGEGAARATAWQQSRSLFLAAGIVAAMVFVLIVVVTSRRGDDGASKSSEQGTVGQSPTTEAAPASASSSSSPAVATAPAKNSAVDPASPSIQTTPIQTTPSLPPSLPGDEKATPPPTGSQKSLPPAKVEPEPPTLPASPRANQSPLLVLAIENKDDRALKPFAVACAVEQDGRQMLLTTARIARVMSLFPQQYYAVLPGGAETGPAVVEVKQGQIFMHLLYMSALEHDVLDTAQYFDVGVLLPVGKLPDGMACRVANRAKVDSLASGSKLRCWTTEKPQDIPYAQEEIDGQYRLKVQGQSVRLSRALLLDNGNDRSAVVRRLFELDGPQETFLEGSPVLDSDGEVVALYSKMPVATDDEAGTRSGVTAGSHAQQPRAALVDAEMIDALWTGRPSKMWFAYVPEKPSRGSTGAGKK